MVQRCSCINAPGSFGFRWCSYVKEHLLSRICDDSRGLMKQWHKNVTVPNLEHLCNLAKEFGMTLPFNKTLEAREHEIKAGSSVVRGSQLFVVRFCVCRAR